MIKHTCRCGKEYSVNDDMNGTKVECECGNHFMFRAGQPKNIWIRSLFSRTLDIIKVWINKSTRYVVGFVVFIVLLVSGYQLADWKCSQRKDRWQDYTATDPAIAKKAKEKAEIEKRAREIVEYTRKSDLVWKRVKEIQANQ